MSSINVPVITSGMNPFVKWTVTQDCLNRKVIFETLDKRLCKSFDTWNPFADFIAFYVDFFALQDAGVSGGCLFYNALGEEIDESLTSCGDLPPMNYIEVCRMSELSMHCFVVSVHIDNSQHVNHLTRSVSMDENVEDTLADMLWWNPMSVSRVYYLKRTGDSSILNVLSLENHTTVKDLFSTHGAFHTCDSDFVLHLIVDDGPDAQFFEQVKPFVCDVVDLTNSVVNSSSLENPFVLD